MTEKYLGAYEIVQTLGEGNFGVVYQAYQPFLDRYVAIKTLHASLMEDNQFEQRFIDEARTIARLRHPNIVSVYEFGTVLNDQKKITYMVMEYLSGPTLHERLKAAQLSVAESISILEALAQALDYAHMHHIIHRDLKPANILFTDAGQPVIVDFGLAQLMALGRPTIPDAEEGGFSGTPAYMAPEQFIGAKIGAAADQYALAAIAYELLCGQKLFGEIGTGTRAFGTLQNRFGPVSVELPESLEPAQVILMRALNINPEDRYAQTVDFVADLANALLPDRQRRHTLVVSDPQQAAQLRATQQTLNGFMWALVAIMAVVIIFCSMLFVRGYIGGLNGFFVWDGVFVSRERNADGMRIVGGVWPGSPAERAGIQIGDLIKEDLLADHQALTEDYTVNGQPRSVLPTSWEPHLGDVIRRTVWRDGQVLQIEYQIVPSTRALVELALVVPATLALLIAIWLLRAWGAEPGLRIIFPTLLSLSFLFLAQLLIYISNYLDTVSNHLFLIFSLIFILNFPTSLRILEKRQWVFGLLFVSLIGPIIEFMIGHGIPESSTLQIQFFSYIGFTVVILGAIIFKWIVRDVRHYRSLWIMIVGVVLIPLIALISTLISSANFQSVHTLPDGFISLIILSRLILSVGASIGIIFAGIGYNRVQRQMGVSYITAVS